MSVAPDVVVVGAGQAGLAVSHELSQAGVGHVVLERGRVAQTWRDRWESFCLVTPNWSVQLPGGHYDGGHPDGFMSRDELVDHLERYAARFDAPVREGVTVTALRRAGGGFVLETSDGDLAARAVVLCNGAYQRPHRPAEIPAEVCIDVEDYSEPGALPDGSVLVVGSGQSGCQIAEELHGSGREVFLACGKAGWAPRRMGDRDLFWWLQNTGDLDDAVEKLPDPKARLTANLQVSGSAGGHDLNYRTLQHIGVTLLGRLLGADGRTAHFADDLAASVAWSDARNAKFMERVRKVVAEHGLAPPAIPEPEPFQGDAPEQLDMRGFGAVIFASGFRPDYSWVDCPGAFDDLGFPVHDAGASTVAPGLYFAGVHFLRKRKSALLMGVGEDAAMVARGVSSASAEVR